MNPTSLPQQIVVFGQRGVGKTSFLNRLQEYWKNENYHFLDLDQEIEKHYQKRISDIFQNEGESVFRSYELVVFELLIKKYSKIVLSVGGGFDVLKIPASIHCLWLQRLSDETGRIFLDRPRLDQNKSDLEEFFDRANNRKIKFEQRADEIYLVPEGLTTFNIFEENIFKRSIAFQESVYITLTPSLIKKRLFLEKIQNSGFEFRDDLLDYNDFENFCKNLSFTRAILSFRSDNKLSTSEDFFLKIKNNLPERDIKVDWPLELGAPSRLLKVKPDIISLHDYLPAEDISQFLKRLESFGSKKIHLKASPIITNFSDLEKAFTWQQKDPENRSLLPRSENGLWTWFRQFMKGRQKINFWKVSAGTAPDQPSLYEWCASIPNCHHMAAVLGSPIKHSRTPLAQQDFFKTYHAPVFAIDIDEAEFNLAVAFLKKLGLLACAVTSPLKKKAYDLVQNSDSGKSLLSTLDKELGTLNTLVFTDNQILGTNTDLRGFKLQVDSLIQKQDAVIIWGGGGTLPIIKSVFPKAIEYSVRSGKPRDDNHSNTNFLPEILIWAAAPNANMPNLKQLPKYIIDLNYKEDSLARSYSKSIGARYISGEAMFHEQALGQQEFWKKYL